MLLVMTISARFQLDRGVSVSAWGGIKDERHGKAFQHPPTTAEHLEQMVNPVTTGL